MTKQTRRGVIPVRLQAKLNTGTVPPSFLCYYSRLIKSRCDMSNEKTQLHLKLINLVLLCKTHELSLSLHSPPGRSPLCLSSATAVKLPHPKGPVGKMPWDLFALDPVQVKTSKMVHNQLLIRADQIQG